jgi:hypothetical protein
MLEAGVSKDIILNEMQSQSQSLKRINMKSLHNLTVSIVNLDSIEKLVI